ncbi:Bicarbonate transport ATP-binding protein CmpC [Rhodocyclaceae bacterium]|nr:Bicarbonate transport ATP-binding protein CmpC [Rhodocyclaceae bacterium]
MNRRDFLKTSGLVLAAAATPFGHFALAGGSTLTLKIGYLPLTDHLLMIAAQREQFKSIRIEPVRFSSWPEIAEALKNGKIHGGFLLTPMGLALRQKGAPIKVVLLGHRNGSAITVKNSPDINRIADLRGKTVAIPSPFSTHNLLLRKALSEKGLVPGRDVKVIDMAPPEMPVALATGRIHGFMVAEPFGAQAEAQKIGKILVLSKDIWKDHICCTLNMQEKVIQSYPAEVQELIAGLIRTASFIESKPAEAARVSVKILGQRPEIVEKVLTTPQDRLIFRNLAPSQADFAATQDYMLKFGVAKDKVDLAGYLDDRFAKRKG